MTATLPDPGDTVRRLEHDLEGAMCHVVALSEHVGGPADVEGAFLRLVQSVAAARRSLAVVDDHLTAQARGEQR